jgi:hypothetical protein
MIPEGKSLKTRKADGADDHPAAAYQEIQNVPFLAFANRLLDPVLCVLVGVVRLCPLHEGAQVIVVPGHKLEDLVGVLFTNGAKVHAVAKIDPEAAQFRTVHS